MLNLDNLTNDIKLCPILPATQIRRKSTAVDLISTPPEAILNILWRLIRACSSRVGAGIAAPQLGIFKRIFVARSDSNEKEFGVFINPSFIPIESNKTEVKPEGCLSVPGKTVPVKRFFAIQAEWQELYGDGSLVACNERLEGFAARVFQHELDHLNGVTLLDKIKSR